MFIETHSSPNSKLLKKKKKNSTNKWIDLFDLSPSSGKQDE